MVNFRKYISSITVLASGLFLAQSTVSAVLFNTNSDSQRPFNLPSPLATIEKTILSPKELVDVNVNTLITDPVLKNATWGFVIYDPKTKKVISSYNENTPLVPASTTKLLTTETALNLLGENYRWMTQLEYSGTVDENGVLNGNIYIVGSGDPSLGTNKAGAWSYKEIITDFTDALSRESIKKVNGDIIIQTALFKGNITRLPENVVWLENNNYYLPAGTTQQINPANEKLIVKKNNIVSNDKKYFYVSPYTNQMVYAEKYDGTGVLTTKLPDAPAYLANSFRTSLVKSGLPVTGKVQTKTTDALPEIRKTLSVYKSPTLADIVYYTNQRSDNSLAEALLKTVGYFKKGNQAPETGREVVTEHLRDMAFDVEGLSYIDGSGLSRNNKVTPIAQVKYLTSLMGTKYYQTYFNSLPIGGQTGTLKRMFLETGNGQVFAKTGTLNKVKTLAGYIKTNTGKTLVFSLLVNNYAGSVDMVKKRMEQLIEPTLDL
ncbi:D-alanyl-D-alanine carboxypeptidase / D-alanyl-D-alanine-endopeptidase (penicillin-binding protein 4) [Chryseobacterium piscicola]|jgi:D-alanyl-D-alanine carboxypeptidase/D-alanyl-D-alanine-endopeptidase (penicillin-binding protein 4)|uniref:D-alanyl-D-alanine carboxypeptidase / D-alanyl-D-alanine-endopeptidase (Penicillin-binding protein 4) n=1 Tax=Chryseobacterium piscicola TaxID=551459 RepID=A0A1N7NWC1_9FLAO|nr:D-alanyl-D-alanine carboxypeptidase/D-alanyl-D-alanine-endopeptidase [Chryseobacterium piscicola]PQA94205.1 D-alanyl-D-alanine carboxypeptidase/D-alanyl-D-alanine-endopeptidase [Chryseobacterium piscicola]SIT02586.1 D-alanyl-D-alanine carboxypeptidase / D-alanyl-D-alanine-endopeptidase (penicillin-binding protein 4) [Chryseobacterium piscicola]